jgi:hypothetical protein
MIKRNITAYRYSDIELFYVRKLYSIYGEKVDFNHRLPEVYMGEFLEFQNSNDLREVKEIEYDNSDRSIFSILSNPDYLGFYEHYIGSEGKIYLYTDRIEKLSMRYANQFNIDFQYCYDIVLFIVLFHELGHWINHWVLKHNSDVTGSIYDNLEIETKETFAQLNLLFALKGYNNEFVRDVRKVFFHLVQHQPRPYQVFLHTKGTKDKQGNFSPSITTIGRYIKLLDVLNYELVSDEFRFILTGKN